MGQTITEKILAAHAGTALIVIALWPQLALADITLATTAFEKGEYTAAMKEFKVLADDGNPTAQNYLGRIYSEGRGIPKNISEAVKWYRRAARQGNAESQYQLGSFYSSGMVVPMFQAPEQKKTRLIENLASIFYLDLLHLESPHMFEDVPNDLVLATETSEPAASGRFILMRSKRQREALQNESAYFWLALSAARGYKGAIPQRDTVATKLTPEELVNVQQEIKEWRPSVEKEEPRKPTLLQKILFGSHTEKQ